PAPLSLSGLKVAAKVFDRGTQATIAHYGSLVGTVPGDDVYLDVSGAAAAFADPQPGTAKPVTVTGLSLEGADAGNYVLVGLPVIVPAAIVLPVPSPYRFTPVFDPLVGFLSDGETAGGEGDLIERGETATAK